MYNRYTPQEDGSFRKRRVSDSGVSRDCPEPDIPLPENQTPPPVYRCTAPMGVGEFLHNLLPEGLDIEDLIVILLLLLITQEEKQDANQALLTMGAYLFL